MWMNYHEKNGRNVAYLEWAQKARQWFFKKTKPDPTWYFYPWLNIKTPAFDL